MNPTPSNDFLTSVSLTRRQILKSLSAGAVAATMGSLSACSSTNKSESTSTANSAPAFPTHVQPFPLTAVRLQDGPFLAAQKRDEKYLLQLEPDRLLHNFRVNAGLTPKAPVYGGWESVNTWADIRAHGHTLGHYLTAIAFMYASTGNPVYKQRIDYIVAELQTCQKATPSGLVCAFPDNTTQFENMAAGRRIVGVPWYTMHKILAGLRDAYLYTNNPIALEVLVKLSDWAVTFTQPFTDDQFQRMLNTEHGGMNEVLADVYVLTNNPKHLALAERFCHRAILDPLSQGKDTLNGLHSNTQIPKVIGFHRLYQITGKPEYLAASQFFWHTVVEKRSFVTGGNGDNEHFFPTTEFARHLASAKTMETCCTYNMLKLTRSLYTGDPSALYAEYYERALYNHILASQDPDSGMMTYFQGVRPGYLKFYCTPFDSFWCCTGTGIENHAKYGDSIYFHTPDALVVNLFISSTLHWKDKAVTLTQNTSFPETGKTQFQFTATKPTPFTLYLRQPVWTTATITLNGKPYAHASTPGSYIPITRTWRTGDTVELNLPMNLHTEPLPGNPDQLALLYGPIVLAGNLGNQNIPPGADLIVNERTYGTHLNPPAPVPDLSTTAASLPTLVKPTAIPLHFTLATVDNQTLPLLPYYQVAHNHFNVYWKVNSPTI